MALLTALQAAFLGAIEGLTEFLPVSSTGHLILFADLVKFNIPSASVFEIVIQLGAILAVCVVYFEKLFGVLKGVATGKPPSLHFAAAVTIAFLPAALAGVLLHDFIKTVLFSPHIVAISLILGGVVMIAIERRKPPSSVKAIEDFTPALSLKIGLAQCLALIPGVSRSGATIIGALLMGVERKTAAEFSFFLAIPTMVGATTYDLWKNHSTLSANDMMTILIGFITAFIVAWFVIRWFIGFVSTKDFMPFAWYRIIFGIIILVWLHYSLPG